MGFIDRRRFVLGFALIVCLALLGRWAMRADDTVSAPPRPELRASVDSSPAKAQLPASAEAASGIPSAVDKSASAFGVFRGRIVDAVTRKPVREFELEFHGTQPTKVGDEAPGARTFQTRDGRFAWEYLPPGNWTVTASARGYQRFALFDLHIPKGDATPEIVLPLRVGHRLRGRIYDEASGAEIASASVAFREADTAFFEGKWRTRALVTSGANGSFVLEGVPPGRVTLMISAQEYMGRELDVVVSDETSPLEIGLSVGGAIAGRLTAADGVTPVAGTAGVFNRDQEFGATRRTGDAGEFLFQQLSAGRYQLSGQTTEGSVTREVVLARNQRMEGVVLALRAGGSIRGVVTGLRPEDMQRTRISLFRDGDAGNPYAEVRLDDRGAYAMHGVQPGRVQVVADVTMRRQVSRTIVVPEDSDIMVNLNFPPGARLSGRVTRGGRPLSGVRLRPRPAVEQPVFVYGTTTSREGKYAVDDLAAGEYAVFVDEYKSRPVQVSGDTVFDIDIPLAQFSGRVLEEGNKTPVVGADVDMWPAEPGSSGQRLHDRSDHFGQFGLAGQEPGEFMLTAYKPGYEMFRKRISYDSAVAAMTISLRRDMGVEVRVHESTGGKPLQEILVFEMVGDRNGSRLQLHLDDDGMGYLPAALSGSTLSFSTSGYLPVVIGGWNGEALDLQFSRQKAQ